MASLFKRLAVAGLITGGIGASAFWFLSAPARLDRETIAEIGQGDAARGQRIFWAGGCTSCHARPKAQGDALLELAGGLQLKTPFGVFVAPNISQDAEDGIGGWSAEDFANAMLRGVSPDGRHYFPAFPYTSYARMRPGDIADLYAFMRTLPAVDGKAPGHSLPFPFSVRRGVGLWKLVNLDPAPVLLAAEGEPEAVTLGRYLVEGPGHCGECHTPRDMTGGTDRSRWLAGAVAAEGEGVVPNITPGEGGIGSWSETDIAYMLETGFLPDFDSVGGQMAAVQRNLAKLAPEDRAAIAAYLTAAPPHPNGYPARQTSE